MNLCRFFFSRRIVLLALGALVTVASIADWLVTFLQKGGDSLAMQLLLAFSVPRSLRSVLGSRRPNAALQSVHGMRFLGLSWVLLGHTYSYIAVAGVSNGLIARKSIFESFSMQWLANGDKSVDVFFVLSGAMLVYVFLLEVEKRRQTTGRSDAGVSWLRYYLHRYWRYFLRLKIFVSLLTSACIVP